MSWPICISACAPSLHTQRRRRRRRHILHGSHLPALIVHIPLLLVTDLWLLACIRVPPATHVNAFLLLRSVSKLTAVRIFSSVDNLARPGLSNSRTLKRKVREKKKRYIMMGDRSKRTCNASDTFSSTVQNKDSCPTGSVHHCAHILKAKTVNVPARRRVIGVSRRNSASNLWQTIARIQTHTRALPLKLQR